MVDGVDYVYCVSIWVNANDGNDVGPNRVIPQRIEHVLNPDGKKADVTETCQGSLV